MKTLKDIKSAMTIGSVWSAFNHIDNKDLGLRPVSIVQTNSVAFKTDRGDSWLQWPKLKDIKFNNENSFTILEDGIPVLTYTKATPRPVLMACGHAVNDDCLCK